MSTSTVRVADLLAPLWPGQDDLIGLAETATERAAQAFRILNAFQLIDDVVGEQSEKMRRMALLGEMAEMLGGQLAMTQQKLVEERRRSHSLEKLLLRIIVSRRVS